MALRSSLPAAIYRFGPFELDVPEKELRKYGSRIKLQGQPFLVLTRLLQNAGRLVSREALKGELWPEDTFVDFEHSLNEAVNKVRAALGDSASRPRFVETVPRHGYRFIADVEAVTAPEPPVEAEEPAPRTSYRLVASIAAAVAAGGLVTWLLLRGPAPSEGAPIGSLAVLPFDNLSGDAAQDYFSDGMTDELTAQLAKIDELRVISRTSARRYKDTNKSLREVGRELGVDALVEGSVRLSEGRVRITVQLVDASSDRSVWTETYEGTSADALDIQNDVARSIAREVRAELSPGEEARLASRDVAPRAYEAYLKGRHHWNKRTEKDYVRAIEYFTEATLLEPSFAEAHAGLADSYTWLSVYGERPDISMPKARAAAVRALELDSRLAEAHTALGCILFFYERSFRDAERELRTAVDVDPGYAPAHQWYGIFLLASSRTDEAVRGLRRAIELDPLSLTMNEHLGWALYVARRYPEAIEQYQKTLELDPTFAQALRYLGLTYLHLGRHEEALETLERAELAFHGEPEVQADLALALALAGRKQEAESILDELIRAAEDRYVSPFLIASFHTGLGNFDEALEWLEKAYERRVANVVFLGVDPTFDPLRAHPRFQSLLARIGL